MNSQMQKNHDFCEMVFAEAFEYGCEKLKGST